MSTKVLRVWTYDVHDGDFYVAESAEEALQMHLDVMGDTGEEETKNAASWVPMDEDRVFLFHLEEDHNGWPAGPHRKTFRELAEWNGKGYLASSNE